MSEIMKGSRVELVNVTKPTRLNPALTAGLIGTVSRKAENGFLTVHFDNGEVGERLVPERFRLLADAPARKPYQPEPAPARTLNLTPTWRGVLPIIEMALEHGTDTGRDIARAELRNMAEAADRWNAHVTAAPDAAPSPEEETISRVRSAMDQIAIARDGTPPNPELPAAREARRAAYDNALLWLKAAGVEPNVDGPADE